VPWLQGGGNSIARFMKVSYNF